MSVFQRHWKGENPVKDSMYVLAIARQATAACRLAIPSLTTPPVIDAVKTTKKDSRTFVSMRTEPMLFAPSAHPSPTKASLATLRSTGAIGGVSCVDVLIFFTGKVSAA